MNVLSLVIYILALVLFSPNAPQQYDCKYIIWQIWSFHLNVVRMHY